MRWSAACWTRWRDRRLRRAGFGRARHPRKASCPAYGLPTNRLDDVDRFMHSVLRVLQKRTRYDSGMLLIKGSGGEGALSGRGFGLDPEIAVWMDAVCLRAPGHPQAALLEAVWHQRKAFTASSIDEVAAHFPEFAARMRQWRRQTIVAWPLIHENASIGLLFFSIDN